MPASTSVKSFFPGKTNSGHMKVNSTPYKQASASPADNSSVSDVQANGQFGNPSGKTVASPLSQINGSVAGAGRGKPSSSAPGPVRGPYGKVRVR